MSWSKSQETSAKRHSYQTFIVLWEKHYWLWSRYRSPHVLLTGHLALLRRIKTRSRIITENERFSGLRILGINNKKMCNINKRLVKQQLKRLQKTVGACNFYFVKKVVHCKVEPYVKINILFWLYWKTVSDTTVEIQKSTRNIWNVFSKKTHLYNKFCLILHCSWTAFQLWSLDWFQFPSLILRG